MRQYELYPHKKLNTLQELLDYCASCYQDISAFTWTEKKKDCTITFGEFRNQVSRAAAWLRSSHTAGQHIAVMGENSYEWILAHFAVTCSGNVIVPIDKDLSAADTEELLIQSDCSMLFCSESYLDIAEQLHLSDLRVVSLATLPQLIQKGETILSEDQNILRNCAPTKNDLASIVFTSGTTGKSKGVMLTHGNFMADVYGSCCNVWLDGDGLLVLPLHHTFGLVAGVFSLMFYGHTVYINRSLKNLSRDMLRYHPQHMFIVPVFAEQFYEKIQNSAKEKGMEKQLRWLARVNNLLMKAHIDIGRRLFRSVHEAFGGKLELLVSGGAPFDEHIIYGLRSLGFNVLNGYGITECGPVVAVNRNRYFIPDSVGLPIVCNEVRINEDNEILIRGENVMTGYYHMEEETKAAFTEDGWFRTGDLGSIDRYGALHIIGRKKNLIILKNGENIPAEPLEALLMQSPLIKEAVVFAKDDMITAEIYLNPDLNDAASGIAEEIRKINSSLPQNRNIANMIIRNEPFPKTTTRKIKRDRRKS